MDAWLRSWVTLALCRKTKRSCATVHHYTEHIQAISSHLASHAKAGSPSSCNVLRALRCPRLENDEENAHIQVHASHQPGALHL